MSTRKSAIVIILLMLLQNITPALAGGLFLIQQQERIMTASCHDEVDIEDTQQEQLNPAADHSRHAGEDCCTAECQCPLAGCSTYCFSISSGLVLMLTQKPVDVYLLAVPNNSLSVLLRPPINA